MESFSDLLYEKMKMVKMRPGLGHKKFSLRQGRLTRMPRHRRRFLLVTSESLNLFLRVSDVEQFEQVIARGRQQPVTVRVPSGSRVKLSQIFNGIFALSYDYLIFKYYRIQQKYLLRCKWMFIYAIVNTPRVIEERMIILIRITVVEFCTRYT